MWAGPIILFACRLAGAAPDLPLQQLLSRVSEEAEVFQLMAPKTLSQETLVQRALKSPPRFRPRLGDAAAHPPKPQYRTREIISEYAFSTFKEAPNVLHEFRQVVSVDGRQITSREKARQTLAMGMRSDDDRLKKRLLETFEKHGLTGAATDFGQVLLLFTRRRLADYSFRYSGEGQIGADAARIVAFRQLGGAGSLLIFEKRKALHQPLEGELWIRRSDSLLLRVALRSLRKENNVAIRDEATVDYTMTPHGVVMPVSVVHRQSAGPDLVVENVFRYAPFRMFAADAEIKFTEEPGPKQ